MLTQQQIKIQKKWKNVKNKISPQLRDIIHGYIMSDGYVYKNGRLQVEQSEQQQKFVMWLYEKLEPLRTDFPISHVTRSRGDVKSYSKRFFTKTLLKGFRYMWYESNVDKTGHLTNSKHLPKSLHCFFNPIFVTLWFAGDGTKLIGSRGAKFEVTNFTPQERCRLQKLFKQKLEISVKIQRAGRSKSGTAQWTIVIPADQYDKFRKVITQIDLIPKLFPNKLHPLLRAN